MISSNLWNKGKLVLSNNRRYLQYENGEPFFWLGDTAWLLSRLTREEADQYLEDRRRKGFNVIQIMAVHSVKSRNAYGRRPFVNGDMTKSDLSPGENGEGSYWDHVDYLVGKAAEKGMYIAMVAVWGSVVTDEKALGPKEASVYGKWLADRYRDRPNLVWLIGGDVRGSDGTEVWLSLAGAIRERDPDHLMTFHPFGRTSSSIWFHDRPWLDFNMFQSGHRRYDQIGDEDPANWKGEDNWRYVQEDYVRVPAKPTLDGEPSYEGIPQGLHDPHEPFWTADDCRRYAYWSVFAGACGHTYGHSAVMQMHKPEYGPVGAYGNRKNWDEALNDPGAGHMRHLKNLILSRPYFERIPDQTAIHGEPGSRYEQIRVTRGRDYLFAYTYTGRSIRLKPGVITGTDATAWWYDPRSGESRSIGTFHNAPDAGVMVFHPPGDRRNGNDWVLVLDDAAKPYPEPGQVRGKELC